MFILLKFVQIFAVSPNFLQQSTSSSALSQGITTLSDELSDFSNNLDNSLSDLDKSIDTSIAFSNEIAVELINGETDTLKLDVSNIHEQIQDLQARLSLATQYCQVISTCSACVECSNCGWCNSESKCLPGSEAGPDYLQCEDWYYSECKFKDCSVYKKCTSCLSTDVCSWCEFGRKCLESQGTCRPAFYISNYESCPEIVLSSPSPKLRNPYLVNQMTDLQENEGDLIHLIENLDADKEDIIESAYSGQKIKISSVGVTADLTGVIEKVDKLATSEEKERQDYRHQLFDQSQQEVSADIQDISSKNNEYVIGEINQDYSRIVEDVGQIESRIGQELGYIDNELVRVVKALNSTKKK